MATNNYNEEKAARRAVVAELFLSGELQGRMQAELALLFWEILVEAGGDANMDQILENPRSEPLRSTKPHSSEGKVKLTARTAVQALRRAGAVQKVGNRYYTKTTELEQQAALT